MSLSILSYPKNPRVYKALIAAKYNGVEIATPNFNFGTDNKTPEFLKKNPNGKVPVLETPEGPIWESNAIARYVARQGKNKLYPTSAYEQAVVEQWIDWSVGEVDLPAAAWLYPILGFIPNNAEATQKAKGDIRKALGILNDHLQTRTFMVGERVTLADIILTISFYGLYTMVLDTGFRKQFTNTNRWFLTCVNQPEFKAVLGEVKLSEKMQVAKETAAAPAAEKPKEPKEPKKKAEPKEKPQPKKKEAEDDGGGDEEEEGEKKPKKQNPLDLLPPSPFVLDEWKRTYSNNDTKTVAMPWFWQHFDPAGWSLWFGEYKYNDELSKIFMTSNLVTGFMQRLDKLRKYGFGSVLIFGKDGEKISISCCFLVRGQVIPPEMTDCDDYELYNWTKVDVNDAAQKQKVEESFSWEGDFNGRGKPADGKVFK
jgi:elongation factor 1-gamma